MRNVPFPEMEGRLRAEIEEILKNTRAHKLSTEMIHIYQEVMVPLEEQGLKFFRQQKLNLKDEVICWNEVLKQMKIPEKDRLLMLVGVLLRATHERIKQNEKGGNL